MSDQPVPPAQTVEPIDALEAEEIAKKFVIARVKPGSQVNVQTTTLSTSGITLYEVNGFVDEQTAPERRTMFSTTPAVTTRKPWKVLIHAENRKILGHSGP